jgi:TM2 domain-containing membrane protein YozV
MRSETINMRKIKLFLLFISLGNFIFSQNIYDSDHRIRFADWLYDNKEYKSAIIEYRHALFLGQCDFPCQFRLFNSYLLTKQFNPGINTYKSVYPQGLANNDTIEMIFGKMLILNTDYSELSDLIKSSRTLSDDQLFFLDISNDLFAEKWENAVQKDLNFSDNVKEDYYRPVINKIENTKYKKPYVSFLLSTVIPGSGKMYSGFWYDGIISLSIVGITAWQAYRGFTLYGSDRPYSWIFATLSVSFYISNLYGSIKAANMKNYNLKQDLHNDAEKIFHSHFTY